LIAKSLLKNASFANQVWNLLSNIARDMIAANVLGLCEVADF